MAKSRKKLIVAAVAFANTPQGKRLIQQARGYLSRPETRQKAQALIADVRARSATKSTKPGSTGSVTYHPPRQP